MFCFYTNVYKGLRSYKGYPSDQSPIVTNYVIANPVLHEMFGYAL